MASGPSGLARAIRYFLALKSSEGKSSWLAAKPSILFFTEPRTCRRGERKPDPQPPPAGRAWGTPPPPHWPQGYLEEGLDAGLEDHVGVQQEGAQEGLWVAGELGQQPRQQEVDVERILQHVLQLGQQDAQEGACGHRWPSGEWSETWALPGPWAAVQEGSGRRGTNPASWVAYTGAERQPEMGRAPPLRSPLVVQNPRDPVHGLQPRRPLTKQPGSSFP